MECTVLLGRVGLGMVGMVDMEVGRSMGMHVMYRMVQNGMDQHRN